jgi:hypothetical protein
VVEAQKAGFFFIHLFSFFIIITQPGDARRLLRAAEVVEAQKVVFYLFII